MRYALSYCLQHVNEDGSVTFTGPSFLYKTDTSVTVPKGAIEACNNGAHVQDACPDLEPHEREFLISGYTGEEWDEMFGTPEENDPLDGQFPEYEREEEP